jgi:arginine exporter protein ArgO
VPAAFIAGVVAGYAIAIPVGAIAVLIVETGVQRGFRLAAAAGAGTATADVTYATVAIVGGSAIGPFVAPWSLPLRIAAIVVLLAIGIRGLVRVATNLAGAERGTRGARDRVEPGGRDLVAIYGRFLGLTLLNPATIIYFAALVLALPALDGDPFDGDPFARPAFVLGAGLASLSWQLLIAAVGAVAHHRLPPGFQLGISLLGNVMICGFAAVLARSIVSP